MGRGTSRAHTAGVREAYQRVLDGSTAQSRFVDTSDGQVHLLETGLGPPLVLLPGDGSFAAWFLPLMERLDGVHAMAVDRPGQGLSDPVDLPAADFRDRTVSWVGRLLDDLGLEHAALAGHSGGGMWALWFALAHPDRVSRLVLVSPPALPHARPPVPLRVMATPRLGELVSRLMPASRTSLTRFAKILGEGETVPEHPDLLDLWVALGHDPVADRASTQSFRALISPYALLFPGGFRRRARIGPEELAALRTPTLLVWGENDPIGDAVVAREVAGLIPECTLELLPAGHLPWLKDPGRVATAIGDLMA